MLERHLMVVTFGNILLCWERMEEGSPVRSSGSLSGKTRTVKCGGSRKWRRLSPLFGFHFQTCSGLPQRLKNHIFVSSLFLLKEPAVQSRGKSSLPVSHQ